MIFNKVFHCSENILDKTLTLFVPAEKSKQLTPASTDDTIPFLLHIAVHLIRKEESVSSEQSVDDNRQHSRSYPCYNLISDPFQVIDWIND